MTAPANSVKLTGLTNGTAYTFKVSATNSVGTSAASVASPAATPQDTIFELATPAMVDSGDTSSVELGVKFTPQEKGTVTGIRFYKAATNTGTHVGSLWSSTGTLLASATFTSESTSGWQQVNFSTPVTVRAGTTYVAGYLAPNGHYSATSAAFSPLGVSNPPLQALANETSANGVYVYSATPTFPSSSFNATNYWVDVLFAPSAASAPEAPEGVTASPATRQALVSWTAPNNERQSDHRLYDHPVRRHDGADACERGRLDAERGGNRADERHELHLQGRGKQRARHRAAVACLECGDSA